MKYWWVNHKQTFKHEFDGGYIWSPKVNKNGSKNQSYQNLTQTKAGDIIFSYAHTFIKAVGVIESRYTEEKVPSEFGPKGDVWNKDGYKVKIRWTALAVPFKPKANIESIKDYLPSKYSPIRENGDGNQTFYLYEISNLLGLKLLDLINQLNYFVIETMEDVEADIKEELEEDHILESPISTTEKEQLIKARIGQGTFRNRLTAIEKRCRVTGIVDPLFLVASHIKPWRVSSNEERLDGNNGLMLSPHVDRLFDKGFISFANNGELIIANDSAKTIIENWKIPLDNVGAFNKKQKEYLNYHRDVILKKSD